MPTPPLSLDEVRALARLLHEADLSEIEVEALAPPAALPAHVEPHEAARHDHKAPAPPLPPAPPVRLQLRRGTEPTVVRRAPGSPSAQAASSAPRPANAPPVAVSGSPAAPATEAGGRSVLSPTVGVFLAPKPALQVGDVVKAGQKAGAVESLKIPTDIFFAHTGRITAILAEDNQGVEYAQPLFQIAGDE